jgi:pimeloyl-ACP methyl ester carboxylesterase
VNLEVDGKRAFAYTAAHEIDPAKPSVVFVHGAGFDHSLYALQSRYFGYHGRNALALDLPAHGRSEGPPIPTVEAMADWVARAMRAAKVEKGAIVGQSLGSLVALELAARHPALVERLALTAVGYPMKVAAPYLEAARTNDYTAFDIYTVWGHAPQVALGANPNPGMWMFGNTQARLERLAPGVLYNDLKAANDYAGGLEAAARVKCPVLFILGERDSMMPPRTAQTLQEKIPGCRTVIIPGAGHTLEAEAPDAVLDALIAFIS